MRMMKGFLLFVLSIIFAFPSYADHHGKKANQAMMDTPMMDAPMKEMKEAKPDKYEGIAITVNINEADADELATLLVGVGKTKAERIVEYRKKHGKFMHPDDLSKVKGIGSATVKKNRERIML